MTSEKVRKGWPALACPSDRRLLINDPDRVAQGIANGILKFLQTDLQ